MSSSSDSLPGFSQPDVTSPVPIHPALDSPDRQIRLFKLKRIDSDTLIGCFHISDLSALPPFHALSYTWGAEQPTKSLVIGDGTLEIRMNLWRFLTSFISLSDKRFAKEFASHGARSTDIYLWIDALCINQADLSEKGVQVSLMEDIFSLAQEVICWPSSSIEEMEAIDEILRGWGSPGSHELDDPFFDTRYWTRAWIQQELIFAKHIRFFSGKHSLELQDKPPGTDRWPSKTESKPLMNIISKRWSNFRNSLPLYGAVMQFERTCECSVLHDHVYAFLSFVRPDMRVPIDYSLPIMRLWWRYIRSYITTGLLPRETVLKGIALSRTTRNLGMDREEYVGLAQKYVNEYWDAWEEAPYLTLDTYEMVYGDLYDRYVAVRDAGSSSVRPFNWGVLDYLADRITARERELCVKEDGDEC